MNVFFENRRIRFVMICDRRPSDTLNAFFAHVLWSVENVTLMLCRKELYSAGGGSRMWCRRHVASRLIATTSSIVPQRNLNLQVSLSLVDECVRVMSALRRE